MRAPQASLLSPRRSFAGPHEDRQHLPVSRVARRAGRGSSRRLGREGEALPPPVLSSSSLCGRDHHGHRRAAVLYQQISDAPDAAGFSIARALLQGAAAGASTGRVFEQRVVVDVETHGFSERNDGLDRELLVGVRDARCGAGMFRAQGQAIPARRRHDGLVMAIAPDAGSRAGRKKYSALAFRDLGLAAVMSCRHPRRQFLPVPAPDGTDIYTSPAFVDLDPNSDAWPYDFPGSGKGDGLVRVPLPSSHTWLTNCPHRPAAASSDTVLEEEENGTDCVLGARLDIPDPVLFNFGLHFEARLDALDPRLPRKAPSTHVQNINVPDFPTAEKRRWMTVAERKQMGCLASAVGSPSPTLAGTPRNEYAELLRSEPILSAVERRGAMTKTRLPSVADDVVDDRNSKRFKWYIKAEHAWWDEYVGAEQCLPRSARGDGTKSCPLCPGKGKVTASMQSSSYAAK
ncbi:hypothetical protein FB451DRAFT_1534622 [Mycena latifolia]|nr:hypothetical protein FB451DRAFT_1534622 [Mycena latifolia]